MKLFHWNRLELSSSSSSSFFFFPFSFFFFPTRVEVIKYLSPKDQFQWMTIILRKVQMERKDFGWHLSCRVAFCGLTWRTITYWTSNNFKPNMKVRGYYLANFQSISFSYSRNSIGLACYNKKKKMCLMLPKLMALSSLSHQNQYANACLSMV